MAAPRGDAVEPNEFLYRRIPVSQGWYDPNSKQPPSRHAFRIDAKRDVDEISVDRAHSAEHPDFRTAEEAGSGPSPHGYYVAVLKAGDLFAQGIRIEPMPEPDNPAHAVLPQLCSATKKTDRAIELQELLASELTIEVLGPFVPT